MLTPWPSLPLLIITLGLLFLMAAMGVFAVAVLRKLEIQRGRSEQRLDELASRLRLIESRIDRFNSTVVPTTSPRDGILGPRPPGSARTNGSAPLRQGPSENSEPRGGPTLIAIPDLAAEGDEPDPQAETELVKRHAEVWTLAAAGMPPAEIARQTGQPIGQVELIVGLYRRLHSSRGRIDHARSD